MSKKAKPKERVFWVISPEPKKLIEKVAKKDYPSTSVLVEMIINDFLKANGYVT